MKYLLLLALLVTVVPTISYADDCEAKNDSKRCGGDGQSPCADSGSETAVDTQTDDGKPKR